MTLINISPLYTISSTLNGFSNQQLVVYHLCNHQQKYSFKQNSSLKVYMEQYCKGFEIEPKYTLNYIITVLLMNWKQLGLLYHCSVKCTGKLRKALRVRHKFIYLNDLRRLVSKHFRRNHFENTSLQPHHEHFQAHLWCVEPEIFEMIKPPLSSSECSARFTCHGIYRLNCNVNNWGQFHYYLNDD